jgi:hypothetical protein
VGVFRQVALVPVLILATIGCTTHSTWNRVSLGPKSRVLMAPSASPSFVDSEFSYEAPTLRGKLVPRNDCRVAERQEVTRRLYYRESPNRVSGVAAAVAGSVLSLGGGALISSADGESDVRPCSDADSIRCDSPREQTLGVGGLLLVTGAVLVGTGLYTLIKPPVVHETRTIQEAPVVTMTSATAPCGSGSLGRLVLSAMLGPLRVVTGLTQDDGTIALVIPPNIQGSLDVVVDGPVPTPERFGTTLKVGDVLGRVVVSPEPSTHQIP